MFVLQNLRLTHKFIIMGLLALLMTVVPSSLYFAHTAPTIAAAELENSGIAPLVALQSVVRLTQQHRGLSAGMLGGNVKLEARRPETRDALTKVMAEFDGLLRPLMSEKRLAEWRACQQRWVALEQAVAQRQLKPGESSAAHTALIAELLTLNGHLLDDYALSLDPSADSYALIYAAFVDAPALAERLGQLRAQGTGYLATGTLQPENRATLVAVKSRAQELYGDMLGNLGKATAGNPDLKANLGDKASVLKAQIATTLTLADQQLIQAAELTFPSETYFQTFTDTINAVYTFNEVALKDLSILLQSRADGLRQGQWWMIGCLTSLLLVSFALTMTFVRGILQQLGGSQPMRATWCSASPPATCPRPCA